VISKEVAIVVEEPYVVSGIERWVRVIKAPYCDDNKAVVGIVGIFEDITERRRAEEDLRQSQQRLLLHRKQTPLGVIEWDLEFRVTAWNPAAERIFGFTAGEAIGRRAGELIVPESVLPHVDQIWASLLQQKGGLRSRNENVGKDGSVLLCEWFNTPLVDASGSVMGVASLVLDITDQRKLENQLRQAQKMEAVGQLAGGVAHDFNNLLQAIMGYTEMLIMKTPAEDSRHSDLMEILNTGKRAGDLTRQLLAFARKQTVLPEVLDLNAVIDGMLNMLRRLIGENVELVWVPKHDVGTLRVDPSQVDQILANLVVNARDAIGDVGRVQISVDNIAVDEAFCSRNADAVPGDYVMLAVSDDGCGMKEEEMARIFEPFFSTKDRGHGTGMGLATVYGIVKQNKGFVDVESQAGRGSTFRVYLPQYETEDADERVEPSPNERKEKGKDATILIVEDEPAILVLGQRMLKQLGYEVLAAGTPEEALRVAKEHAGGIDMLLTDVILPEMSGRDLADSFLTIRPGAKLLFMSGYAADVVSQHGVLEENTDFLQKPFSIDDFASKVQQALGE
jgi:PAS domain S-box-containing protein